MLHNCVAFVFQMATEYRNSQRHHSADGVSTYSTLPSPLCNSPVATDLFRLFCSWLTFH